PARSHPTSARTPGSVPVLLRSTTLRSAATCASGSRPSAPATIDRSVPVASHPLTVAETSAEMAAPAASRANRPASSAADPDDSAGGSAGVRTSRTTSWRAVARRPTDRAVAATGSSPTRRSSTLVARLSLTAATRTARSATGSAGTRRCCHSPESPTASAGVRGSGSAGASSPAWTRRATSTSSSTLPTLAVGSTASASRSGRPAPPSTSITHAPQATSGPARRSGPGSSGRAVRLLLDQFDERAEGGLRVDEGHRRPPAARAGLLVDDPPTLGLDRLEGGRAVVDPVADVVEALAAALQELGDGRVGAGRGEELHVAVRDLEQRLLDAVGLDHLPVVDLGAEGVAVVRDGGLEVVDGDGDVVDLGQEHTVNLASQVMSASTPPPVRVGFYGAGFISQFHVAALAASSVPNEIVAVHDPDAERAARFAASHGGRAVGEDELLELVDAVYVATWTSEHPRLVEKAAAAGRAVFCEKPVAVDAPTVERMVAAVERAGVVNQVGLVLRFLPSFRWVRHLVRDEQAGRVLAVVCRDDQSIPNQGVYGSTWRVDAARAGRGTLLEHSIHDVDILQWLLGPVCAVSATAREVHGHPGIDDVVVARLDFAG